MKETRPSLHAFTSSLYIPIGEEPVEEEKNEEEVVIEEEKEETKFENQELDNSIGALLDIEL